MPSGSMIFGRWRALASILVGVILVSSSFTSFQNFSTKNNDQNSIIPKVLASSGDTSDIDSYVIFGFSGARLESKTIVTSGDVGSQNATTSVYVESGVTMTNHSSALVGDSVTIEKGATVNDVYYNSLINFGTMQGSKITPLALPVINTFPMFPQFTAGSTNVNVPSGTLVLNAGRYGNVTVGDSATLELTGGTYSINSLKTGKNSNILFDATSQVDVATTINTDTGAKIGPSSSTSIDAKGIIFFVISDVNTGTSSTINANIYSKGDIRLGEKNNATGAFIGNTVRVEQDSTITLNSVFGLLTIPNITWTPSTFSVQAKPSVPLVLNFTSSGLIQNASIVVSSQLNNIVTVPWSVSNITAEVIQQLPITITIPPGTTSGWHNGTITLFKSGTQLSNAFVLNILVPSITTTNVPVSGGNYVYIQTPSNSPTFTNTSDLSVYFTFQNGTKILLQTYYDVFQNGIVLPTSFDVSSSQNLIQISSGPLDILNKVLFQTNPISIPEVSGIMGTTVPQSQCTNYAITYHFEKFAQPIISNDISVANNALSVNTNNPLIVRDDIRWRDVDKGYFANNGTWISQFNNAAIDNFFNNLPTGVNAFVILSVQDPPHAIAIKDQITVPNRTPTTFAEFVYKDAANAFISHTINHIKSISAFNSKVVYWQIDNEPNTHPVMTIVKQLQVGYIFADWRTTTDALQLWLGTAKSLDPTRPTVMNVYEASLPAPFVMEPYRNLLASNHMIGQELINNLGIMSFDIYPDQWTILVNVVKGFQRAMGLVDDQFTYAQNAFGFTGRWGIDEMAAGPKLPLIQLQNIGAIFLTQNVTPTDMSNMINETRTSQFGGQFPAFISLFQLRALDSGNLASNYPFNEAYGLVNGTSGHTNDGTNSTPNFLGYVQKSVVQNCPPTTQVN